MAYVINDGDRQSDKFQHFVDMCCQAFNILRKHANLFINLFSLVSITIFSVIHQLSSNAHQFSTENAINSSQDFYRVQRSCLSMEGKYFSQLPVEVPLSTFCKPSNVLSVAPCLPQGDGRTSSISHFVESSIKSTYLWLKVC